MDRRAFIRFGATATAAGIVAGPGVYRLRRKRWPRRLRFSQMDANGDKSVTKEEFVAFQVNRKGNGIKKKADTRFPENPAAFEIDLHVDDSDGVRMEGEQHGFQVVMVTPDDRDWIAKVLRAADELAGSGSGR